MRVQRAERMWTTPSDRARGYSPPQVVNIRISRFRVGVRIQRGHSGSGLHSQLRFTGGSECSTHTGWILGHSQRYSLLAAIEAHCRREMQNSLFGFAAR